MKSLLKYAVVAMLVISAGAFAADNAMKARISDGAGGTSEATFGSKDLTTYIVPKHTLVDQTGAEILGQQSQAKSTATDTTSVSLMQVTKQVSASAQAIASSVAGTLTVGLPSGASSSAKQDTTNTNLGAPGDSTCATDTGSCGLNAKLSRIAERITSLIGTFNANGQATAANSSPVVLPATQMAVAAKGAASGGNAMEIGGLGSGATGGLLAGLKTCDSHAKYDASDNGSITMVTGVSGRKIYICGFILATGGTATNLKLREGSDANCASNAADLTPAYQLSTNDRIGMMSSFWTGLVVSTNAYYVCVNASAGNAHQAEVWYTIQ